MIIQIINIQHVYAIKPENDPVIFVDLHGPEACQVPRKLVKPITGNIHVTRQGRRVQAGQDQSDFSYMLELQLRDVPFVVKQFQSLVLKTGNHPTNVTRNVSRVNIIFKSTKMLYTNKL